MVQVASKSAEEATKTAQDGSKMPPGLPGSLQDGPKRPRGSQNAPKTFSRWARRGQIHWFPNVVG
eukprot:7199255-Pyramimonas_sp.AAC.1